MGFIANTGSDKFGIEFRRESVRIYDEEGCPEQYIFCYSNENGSPEDSVEIYADQLLRIVDFFNNEDNYKRLKARCSEESR